MTASVGDSDTMNGHRGKSNRNIHFSGENQVGPLQEFGDPDCIYYLIPGFFCITDFRKISINSHPDYSSLGNGQP